MSQDDTAHLLEVAPDAQWRLLIALARFGGLGIPTEALSLRWEDIDWDSGRITVHSPKTEHHPGGESRVIPLFPLLRPHLEEAFEQAVPGAEFAIERYRDPRKNLRTHFLQIIRQAGLQTWPKPWQNLWASRETELAEQHPIHVVCAWIGDSRPVAMKHYLQIGDADFSKALQKKSEGRGGFPLHPSLTLRVSLPIHGLFSIPIPYLDKALVSEEGQWIRI